MLGNSHARFRGGESSQEPTYPTFTAATLIIAVPTGIKIFSWLSKSLRKTYVTKYNRNEDLNNIYTSSSKALVPYGTNLSSTVGSPKYTALERKSVQIPKNLLHVFIGIILSDAHVSKSYKADARLQFKQTINHIEYFYFIFFKLSHYCSKGPYTTRTIVHKKDHIGLGFTTRSLSCITELYNIFYVNNKKIVPSNLYDLLS